MLVVKPAGKKTAVFRKRQFPENSFHQRRRINLLNKFRLFIVDFPLLSVKSSEDFYGASGLTDKTNSVSIRLRQILPGEIYEI